MPFKSQYYLHLYICIYEYKYIYISYIYIYVIYVSYIHLYIIYISYSYYIIYTSYPVPLKKKTSNLNFQHCSFKFFSSSSHALKPSSSCRRVSCAQHLGFPPGKMENTILGKEKTPVCSPEKTCGNLKLYQENSTKSPQIRNLRFLLFCQHTFQVDTATAEEKRPCILKRIFKNSS